jgi:hypothetical protein
LILKHYSLGVGEANPIKSNNDDKYYPYEFAFDFEAMLRQIKTNDESKKLQITSEHVPVSVLMMKLML